MKQQYLKYIKGFSKINISALCRDLNINRENILKGKASEETTKKLYNKLKKELKVLEDKDEKEKIKKMG